MLAYISIISSSLEPWKQDKPTPCFHMPLLLWPGRLCHSLRRWHLGLSQRASQMSAYPWQSRLRTEGPRLRRWSIQMNTWEKGVVAACLNFQARNKPITVPSLLLLLFGNSATPRHLGLCILYYIQWYTSTFYTSTFYVYVYIYVCFYIYIYMCVCMYLYIYTPQYIIYNIWWYSIMIYNMWSYNSIYNAQIDSGLWPDPVWQPQPSASRLPDLRGIGSAIGAHDHSNLPVKCSRCKPWESKLRNGDVIIYIYMYVYIYVYVYVCMYVHIYICILYINICMYIKNMYVYNAYINMYMYIYIYLNGNFWIAGPLFSDKPTMCEQEENSEFEFWSLHVIQVPANDCIHPDQNLGLLQCKH